MTAEENDYVIDGEAPNIKKEEPKKMVKSRIFESKTEQAKELTTWKHFAIAMCVGCVLLIFVTALIVMQNDDLRNQIKIYRNGTADISNSLVVLGTEYDNLVDYTKNLTQCYWSETEVANRVARCGLNQTIVYGGGCGHLIFEDNQTDMIVLCQDAILGPMCWIGSVNWSNRYGFEENIDFVWQNKTEYCPKPEGTQTMRRV